MKTPQIVLLFLLLALLGTSCGGGASDGAPRADAADAAPSTEPTPEPEPTELEATPEPEPSEPEATPEPEPTEPEATPAPEPTEPAEPETEQAVASAGACASTVPETGTSTATLNFEDRERTYEQVVPSSYDGVTPLPVVLNWHGLGSTGPEQLGFSGYAALAQAENFIVIAPTGVPSPGDDRNSWELEPDSDPTRDDLGFASELLDTVIDRLCVDESRIYTTGMSNGGYFSSVLVCNLSDRIAAAASVAALSHPDDCEPERVVPYIGFHGTDDAVVPFDGSGESSLAPGVTVPLFLLRIDDEFAEFAETAGCDLEPTVTDESENVISYDYSGCANDVQMTFYEIEGGGHTWPGSAISLAISEAIGLGVTTDEINASQVSWDFFKQYSLPSN